MSKQSTSSNPRQEKILDHIHTSNIPYASDKEQSQKFNAINFINNKKAKINEKRNIRKLEKLNEIEQVKSLNNN